MNNDQFEKYQEFTEQTIHKLSQQVTLLEKKLDMFTNLLEISKYINQYIKDPNLFQLINDMLIGVFGANNSTIYIKLSDDTYEAAINNISEETIELEIDLILKHKEEEIIINSETAIYANQTSENSSHSCLGVPVKVDNRMIGFILIQHREMNYFTKEHAIFLSLIGNHIGVAIENNFLYKQVKENAYRDGLTEIFNKRYFFDTLSHITNLSEQNYCISIIDLDDFKYINDTYGHPVGDVVLKTIAKIIQNGTRNNDIVARYGGDEIIIYIQNFTERERIKHRFEVLCEEIAKTVIVSDNISLSTTVSIGVFVKSNEILSLDEVIKKADEIMYLSKTMGKNRVTII